MKFVVTMKTPDAISQGIEQAAQRYVDDLGPNDMSDDEIQEEVLRDKQAELCTFVNKWVKYSEYITIEFDTDAGTATVLEVKS
jgi:hypothetical protein